jgi:hypothetical protein
MNDKEIFEKVSSITLGEDEKRFLGKLYPDNSSDPSKIYTIKCQLISTNDGDVPNVEVTYSLTDFKFRNGKSIEEIIDWQSAIRPLSKICVFDAKCEKLEQNKFKLTDIRTVCYI